MVDIVNKTGQQLRCPVYQVWIKILYASVISVVSSACTRRYPRSNSSFTSEEALCLVFLIQSQFQFMDFARLLFNCLDALGLLVKRCFANSKNHS
jgi:hypothetical protein